MEFREVELESQLSEVGVRDRYGLVQSMELTKHIQNSLDLLLDCFRKVDNSIQQNSINFEEVTHRMKIH